jgi:hypothetical protein
LDNALAGDGFPAGDVAKLAAEGKLIVTAREPKRNNLRRKVMSCALRIPLLVRSSKSNFAWIVQVPMPPARRIQSAAAEAAPL